MWYVRRNEMNFSNILFIPMFDIQNITKKNLSIEQPVQRSRGKGLPFQNLLGKVLYWEAGKKKIFLYLLYPHNIK